MQNGELRLVGPVCSTGALDGLISLHGFRAR
jgi:hypothetical protein